MNTQLFMRVKFLLLIAFISLVYGNLQSQSHLTTYDFPPFQTPIETGRSIDLSTPTNYSIAGYSNSPYGAGDFDWIYKKVDDTTGNVLCATLMGFEKTDSCFSHTKIFPTPLRGDVLAGFYTDLETGTRRASITFMDTNCTPQRSFWIAEKSNHEWRQVISHNLPTGGRMIALAGFIDNSVTPAPGNKILVAQYTPAGALVWAFRYNLPVTSVDEAYSITYQPATNTYAVTGTTTAFGGVRAFILNLSIAGAPLGFYVYNAPPGDQLIPRRIITLPGGDYAVAGWSNANDPAASQFWVMRVNALFVPAWSTIYGFNGTTEQWQSMVFSPGDNTVILTGNFNRPGTEDIINGKLNAATGAPVWHRYHLNSTGDDRGYDLKIDNVRYNAYTGQYAINNLDSYLMRTTPAGTITFPDCLIQIEFPRISSIKRDTLKIDLKEVRDERIEPRVNPVDIKKPVICPSMAPKGLNGNEPEIYELKQNYPNPFNPETNIQFAIPEDGTVTIKIYNSAGKEVSVLMNEHKVKGSYIAVFDAGSLPSGIYYYKLTSGSFTQVRKMLLLK